MTAESDLLRKIALPTLLGQTIGQEFFGEPYVVFPWAQYAEKRIIPAIRDRSRENFFILNAPPQTGKSTLITLMMTWIAGMLADRRQMYLSYSDDFSEARSKDVRAILKAWGKDLFGVSIDPDRDKIGDWGINGARGGLLAKGIEGQVVGRSGDVIWIDDLIKNPVEAASTSAKAGHLLAWDGTIARRLQPGGTVILVATRWAEDDLSGALISRMREPGYDGPKWEVISFPAFAEPSPELDGELTPEELAEWRDIIGREYGQVLDCRFSRIPGRAPEDFFNLARAGIKDPSAWACQYQQRPFDAEGSMFPRVNWQRYDPNDVPEMDKMVRVWDLAGTDGGGDWTVGTKVGRSGDRIFILDVQRFRKASGEVMNRLTATAGLDGHACMIKVEEEKGGAGKSVIAAIQKLLPTYNIEPAKAEGDKKSRATPYSSEQQNRRVYIPEDGTVTWDVKGFIDEHEKMMADGRLPRHDDQIDTAAYAVLELIGTQSTALFIPQPGHGLSPEAQMRLLEAQTGIGGGMSDW